MKKIKFLNHFVKAGIYATTYQNKKIKFALVNVLESKRPNYATRERLSYIMLDVIVDSTSKRFVFENYTPKNSDEYSLLYNSTFTDNNHVVYDDEELAYTILDRILDV